MSSESLMDSDLDGGVQARIASARDQDEQLRIELQAAAFRYGAQGQPVFPCYPTGVDEERKAKAPTIRWREQASTDPRAIRGWWRKWPYAIGCRPALCTTCSTSTTSPAAPTATGSILRRLESEGLLTGVVRWVKTPSGGVHAYFPANSDPMQAMVNAQYAHAGVDLVLKNRCRAASSLVFKPRGLGVQVSLLRYGQPRSRPRRGGSTARV
jgi:Bifunctional DNA primase/polymerase, N-terminal